MKHKALKTILLLLIGLHGLLFTSTLHAELMDRIVAIVNDDIITLSDIESEGEDIFKQVAKLASAEERDATLGQVRKDILASLIDKKLVEQRAARFDLSVTKEEIDQAVEHTLTRNNITHDEFAATLAKRGGSVEKFRDSLKWEILKSKLVSLEVQSKLVIPEGKIKEYYTANYEEGDDKNGYFLQQIGFLLKENSESVDREQLRARAEETRQLAVQGKNFQDLAREHSDLPSAPDGGNIGFVKKDELAPDVAAIIEKLKPGEISPLLELPSNRGFQFFKVVSSKEGSRGKVASLDDVRSQITESLHEKEMKAQYEKWVRKLREDAYIKELL